MQRPVQPYLSAGCICTAELLRRGLECCSHWLITNSHGCVLRSQRRRRPGITVTKRREKMVVKWRLVSLLVQLLFFCENCSGNAESYRISRTAGDFQRRNLCSQCSPWLERDISALSTQHWMSEKAFFLSGQKHYTPNGLRLRGGGSLLGEKHPRF